MEAVTEPVTTNPLDRSNPPEMYEAVAAIVAYDDEPNKLPVKEPVYADAVTEPVTTSPSEKFKLPVMYDAVSAIVAYEAEPKKLPVKLPVNDPVFTCADDDTSVGLLTSVLKSPPADVGAQLALTAYEELRA